MTRRAAGFSLMEVLIALALATIVLGVLLSSASTQTMRIARVDTRYQAILTASAVLDRAANQKFTGRESGEEGDFEYEVVVGTVPADPRVDELKATVTGPRGLRVEMAAYRLRAQHQDPGAETP